MAWLPHHRPTRRLELDPILDRLVLAAIDGYRRHLSPRKGYCCAHRVVHGGASCSSYAGAVVAESGWRTGLGKLRARFRACASAARTLEAGRARSHHSVYDAELDDTPGEKADSSAGAGPASKSDECFRDLGEAGCWCGAECCGEGMAQACQSIF